MLIEFVSSVGQPLPRASPRWRPRATVLLASPRRPWPTHGRRVRRMHGRGGRCSAGWHRRLRVNAQRMSSPASDKSEKTRRVPSPMDAVLEEDATEVGARRGAMLSPENGRAVATDAKVCGGGDAARRGDRLRRRRVWSARGRKLRMAATTISSATARIVQMEACPWSGGGCRGPQPPPTTALARTRRTPPWCSTTASIAATYGGRPPPHSVVGRGLRGMD